MHVILHDPDDLEPFVQRTEITGCHNHIKGMRVEVINGLYRVCEINFVIILASMFTLSVLKISQKFKVSITHKLNYNKYISG